MCCPPLRHFPATVLLKKWNFDNLRVHLLVSLPLLERDEIKFTARVVGHTADRDGHVIVWVDLAKRDDLKLVRTRSIHVTKLFRQRLMAEDELHERSWVNPGGVRFVETLLSIVGLDESFDLLLIERKFQIWNW